MGKKRKKVDLCDLCGKAKHPAITAAKLGHESCLIVAYRHLGVFNERDDYGATPVHYAARNGRTDCLQWLVQYSGISPNAAAHNGATAAHDAAAVGHLDCLQYLLQQTHCSASDRTVEGASVLHIACRFGRAEVVEWLLAQGDSSPVDTGANNVTPVHLAAAKNHLECLKHLTSYHDYVPNLKTVHGATPVYFAAQEGSLECLQWLYKEGSGDLFLTAEDGMGPIHAAAQAGQLSCLVWMVQVARISPSHKARDGATPAHFAAASGQVECLEWILDNGGSAGDRDDLGGTPVHDAAEQGQVETLTVLIKRGVNTSMEDYDGMKPFDLAKDNKHQECMKLLFKAINTNILVSLTPHHSLSRASHCSDDDDDRTTNRLEKQRLFEEAMLAGISEERQEAMWESAQQNQVMHTQPGLKMLLKGGVSPVPSDISLGAIPVEPKKSQYRSYRSGRSVSTHRSSLGSELFRDHPAKIRPALDPSIFLPQPNSEASPVHKRVKPLDSNNRVVSTKQQQPLSPPSFPPPSLSPPSLSPPSPSQTPNRMSFLKRLKFKKKFLSPKSGRDKKKSKAAKKLEKDTNKLHHHVVIDDSLQEVEFPCDEELPPKPLEPLQLLQDQLLTLPKGSLEDVREASDEGRKNEVIVDVVVHETAGSASHQYNATWDEGVTSHMEPRSTGPRSTGPMDTGAMPYEEQVTVVFKGKPLDTDTIGVTHQQVSTVNNDTTDEEVPDKDEESSSEYKSQLPRTEGVHDSAEVVHDNLSEQIPNMAKPPGHALLKEVAVSERSKKEQDVQDPGEVFMELRGLSEAGGVQKLINRMKVSRQETDEVTTSATSASPSQNDTVFRHGGVSKKLRLFGERQGPSSTQLNNQPSDEEEEKEDIVAPLPLIKQNIVHSYSQERLRIDGRSPEIARRMMSPSLLSQEKSVLSPGVSSVQSAHLTSVDSPSRVRRIAAVYNPLMVSSDGQVVGENSEKLAQSHREEEEGEEGTHSLTQYMNSANMPHIKQARQHLELAEREMIERQVEALLESPQLTGDSVPPAYRHLDLSAGLLAVWRIKNDCSLEPFPEEKFESSDVHICLQVNHNGPVLYHIHQWVGEIANASVRTSGDAHCELLYKSLPSRPVIHRHHDGHETQCFVDMFGGFLDRNGKSLYYNKSLKKAILYKWCEGEFVVEDNVSETVLHSEVHVLDTATGVWVWLPNEYRTRRETEQPTPFSIVNEFLKQQEYPQHTPATVVTQYAETQEFCDQFLSWTHHNLASSSRAADLRIIANTHQQTQSTPVGQTKVWSLRASGDKQQVPLDLFGHFFSDQTYLIQHTSSHHKTIIMYIWIGSDVWGKTKAISNALSNHYEDTISEVVVVLDGMETSELLNLFKGKLITHKTTLMTKQNHLYCISGEKSLQTKAVEMIAVSSNLSTCHCFLLKTISKVFAWSGQYSSVVERRAALLFAKVIAKNRELTVISEGLEPPEFWTQLGGKQAYTHYEMAKLSGQPAIYCYSAASPASTPMWCPLPRSHGVKDRDKCYMLCNGHQLVMLWSKKVMSSLHCTSIDLVQEFIAQCHSHKSLTDFIITLVRQGKEGGHAHNMLISALRSLQEQPYQLVQPDTSVHQQSLEDKWNEDKKGEEQIMQAVPLRDTPTSHPLPLTISQEEVFSNVQKLQAALNEAVRQQKLQPQDSNQLDQLDRSSKLRTSAAMEQLHHMIQDLDGMTHTTPTATSQFPSQNIQQTVTPAAEPPGPPPPAPQPIHRPQPASPLPRAVNIRKERGRHENESSKKLPMMQVRVFVEEKGEEVELQVREDAPAITIIFRALNRFGLRPYLEHSLFEVCDLLKIERPLEDHEGVSDVISSWPSKQRPRLVVRRSLTKYLLWDASSPIPQESVAQFLKDGQAPEVTSKLQYCKKPKTMSKWVEGPFCLGTLGMYAIGEAKRSSRLDLLASTDHYLYMPISSSQRDGGGGGGKNQGLPSPYCFIMKPLDSWKQKDLKIFSAADEPTLNMWITGLRLVKYGAQLKRNYLAMNKRLQKTAMTHPHTTH